MPSAAGKAKAAAASAGAAVTGAIKGATLAAYNAMDASLPYTGVREKTGEIDPPSVDARARRLDFSARAAPF